MILSQDLNAHVADWSAILEQHARQFSAVDQRLAELGPDLAQRVQLSRALGPGHLTRSMMAHHAALVAEEDRKSCKIVLAITNVSDDEGFQNCRHLIETLGGRIAEDWDPAVTHLVTSALKGSIAKCTFKVFRMSTVCISLPLIHGFFITVYGCLSLECMDCVN